MTKKQLLKEALVASSLMMAIVFVLNYFPLKFEVTRPIKQEFADFDIYDLYYSDKHEANRRRDRDIVLFQVADSRKEIALQLLKIQALEPAVIGLDVTFSPRNDSIGNSMLLSAFGQIPSMVYSYRFLLNDSTSGLQIGPSQVPDSLLSSHGGYINFLGEEHTVVRYYSPFFYVDKKNYPALTSRILEKYSPAAFDKLAKRNNKIEIINYTGNINNYENFTLDDLDKHYDQLKELVTGKIVLVGYFSRDPLVLEDIKFTPLNHRFAGKSFPDMYGVVVHANILTMLLSGSYATLMPLWVSYLLAFIFTFLFMMYIISRHHKNPHPAHWKIFLVHFFSIIIIVFLFLLLFSWVKIKVQLLPIIISIVLTVELFGLYKSFARWLFKKIKYETIFKDK